MENQYYQNYKGPNLSKALLWKTNDYKIDITEYIEIFYGNNNWNSKLYKFKEIFPGKGFEYKFYIEFISNNGRKHWFNGNVGLPDQYFNPPLITPYNEYELEDNISDELNNCNIK